MSCVSVCCVFVCPCVAGLCARAVCNINVYRDSERECERQGEEEKKREKESIIIAFELLASPYPCWNE